jgi:predicted Zn-ribbon and HTH transcriptional regulator
VQNSVDYLSISCANLCKILHTFYLTKTTTEHTILHQGHHRRAPNTSDTPTQVNLTDDFRRLCLHCGVTWQKRVPHEPQKCPNCQSKQWRTPKQTHPPPPIHTTDETLADLLTHILQEIQKLRHDLSPPQPPTPPTIHAQAQPPNNTQGAATP